MQPDQRRKVKFFFTLLLLLDVINHVENFIFDYLVDRIGLTLTVFFLLLSTLVFFCCISWIVSVFCDILLCLMRSFQFLVSVLNMI